MLLWTGAAWLPLVLAHRAHKIYFEFSSKQAVLEGQPGCPVLKALPLQPEGGGWIEGKESGGTPPLGYPLLTILQRVMTSAPNYMPPASRMILSSEKVEW